MRIVNIVRIPDHPRDSQQTLQCLVPLQRKLGDADLGFILTIEPEQPPYLEKLTTRLETFQHVRDRLLRKGIRSGILVQTTLGHAERFLPTSPAPFQRMINTDGAACQAVFCPLDPAFQEHTLHAMEMIAAARPAFVLIDDDMRLEHPGLPRGCFCPLHMNLHAELHGARLTRDELLVLTAQDTTAGAQTRRQWFETERESLLRFAAVVRRGIDKADATIPAGFCATPSSRLINDKIARAVAGSHRPVVRVASHVYMENGAKHFPELADHIARQRRYLGDDVEVLAEADTYPHHHYSVSKAKLMALLVTSMLLGLDGAKAWILPQFWEGGENPDFAEAYHDAQPLARALEPLAKKVHWHGAATPIRDDEPYRLPWDDNAGKCFLVPAWANVFGRLTLPQIPGGLPGTVRAFSGESVLGYSLQEWRTFLRAGVLLDGSAATHLTDIGLADQMGVRATLDQNLRFNLEHYADTPTWNGRSSDTFSTAIRLRPHGIVRLTPTSPDTRILGKYTRQPWRDADGQTPVAPAVTAYANSTGGKVAVYAAALDQAPLLHHFIHPTRRPQLSNILEWLGPNEFPLRVECDTDLYTLIGTISDDEILVYLLNLQPDPIATTALTPQRGALLAVRRLNSEGCWISQPYDLDARRETIQVHVGLAYLGYAILRIGIDVQQTIKQGKESYYVHR